MSERSSPLFPSMLSAAGSSPSTANVVQIAGCDPGNEQIRSAVNQEMLMLAVENEYRQQMQLHSSMNRMPAPCPLPKYPTIFHKTGSLETANSRYHGVSSGKTATKGVFLESPSAFLAQAVPPVPYDHKTCNSIADWDREATNGEAKRMDDSSLQQRERLRESFDWQHLTHFTPALGSSLDGQHRLANTRMPASFSPSTDPTIYPQAGSFRTINAQHHRGPSSETASKGVFLDCPRSSLAEPRSSKPVCHIPGLHTTTAEPSNVLPNEYQSMGERQEKRTRRKSEPKMKPPIVPRSTRLNSAQTVPPVLDNRKTNNNNTCMTDLDREATNGEAERMDNRPRRQRGRPRGSSDQRRLARSGPAQCKYPDGQQHISNPVIVPLSPPIRPTSLLEYPGYSYDAEFDDARHLVAIDSEFQEGWSNNAEPLVKNGSSPKACVCPCVEQHRSHFMPTPRFLLNN